MCGDTIPGNDRLPVLVGETLDRCPTAAFLQQPDVRMLAEMVQSRDGPGTLAGVPLAHLPPYYRHAMAVAGSWREAWTLTIAKDGG